MKKSEDVFGHLNYSMYVVFFFYLVQGALWVMTSADVESSRV